MIGHKLTAIFENAKDLFVHYDCLLNFNRQIVCSSAPCAFSRLPFAITPELHYSTTPALTLLAEVVDIVRRTPYFISGEEKWKRPNPELPVKLSPTSARRHVC